jgi:hypothetical protein
MRNVSTWCEVLASHPETSLRCEFHMHQNVLIPNQPVIRRVHVQSRAFFSNHVCIIQLSPSFLKRIPSLRRGQGTLPYRQQEIPCKVRNKWAFQEGRKDIDPCVRSSPVCSSGWRTVHYQILYRK